MKILNFKASEAGIIDKVIYGAIGLAVLFLMLSTIVLPYFNTTYNYVITGLNTTFYQGIMVLLFFLAILGFALAYIPRKH
jgi:hypothetical protein